MVVSADHTVISVPAAMTGVRAAVRHVAAVRFMDNGRAGSPGRRGDDQVAVVGVSISQARPAALVPVLADPVCDPQCRDYGEIDQQACESGQRPSSSRRWDGISLRLMPFDRQPEGLTWTGAGS